MSLSPPLLVVGEIHQRTTFGAMATCCPQPPVSASQMANQSPTCSLLLTLIDRRYAAVVDAAAAAASCAKVNKLDLAWREHTKITSFTPSGWWRNKAIWLS